jgi:hypothetical protein
MIWIEVRCARSAAVRFEDTGVAVPEVPRPGTIIRLDTGMFVTVGDEAPVFAGDDVIVWARGALEDTQALYEREVAR